MNWRNFIVIKGKSIVFVKDVNPNILPKEFDFLKADSPDNRIIAVATDEFSKNEIYEKKFNDIMDEKLHSLIRVTYPSMVPINFDLKIIYFPQKSSTILEYLS